MNITTSYRVSFEELHRASRLGLRRRRRLLWVCAVVLTADGALLFALDNLTFAVAAVTGGAFLLYQLTAGTRRGTRRALAKITGAVEVDLTEESVRIRRPGLHTEIAWRQYHRVVDTPEFLLLYTTPFAFTAVPKRGLDAAQTTELAAFVADLNGTTPPPPPRVAPSRASVPVRTKIQ
ncbi:YcxB family protein [Kitasatospora sp. NBC_00374]|uniref:YcxB family protein n=1 Tax=Kitasatospora sp. NBC_00374 TaxID=2975964 RepID=UPI00324C89A7